MKKRYYEVARKLAETRITDPELAAKNPVINTPYDYEGEIKRKQQLDLIYTRPRDVEARENALREQLRKIENIKKKRADEERKKEKRTEKRGKGKKKGKKKGGQVDAGEQPQEQQQGDRKLPQEKKQDGDKLPSQDKELPDQQDANGGDKEREDDQVDEQDSLVANVIKQLKPGAYARSALMSAIEKGEADSMIDTVMQEHGIIKTPMPTSKIHEAYEQLRGRITALLDLKLKVGKNELLNMKLNQQREKVVQGEKRKKPETSETIDGDDAERPNKKKKLM
jgi:thymidylate synthase